MIRGETGWPPLASPIGQVLACRRSSTCPRRSAGRSSSTSFATCSRVGGSRPARSTERARAVALLSEGADSRGGPADLDDLREDAEGVGRERGGAASSWRSSRATPRAPARDPGAGAGKETEGAALGRGESERLRELIRVVQESGIGELTIEEGSGVYRAQDAGRRGPPPSRVRAGARACADGGPLPRGRGAGRGAVRRRRT